MAALGQGWQGMAASELAFSPPVLASNLFFFDTHIHLFRYPPVWKGYGKEMLWDLLHILLFEVLLLPDVVIYHPKIAILQFRLWNDELSIIMECGVVNQVDLELSRYAQACWK
jgi:hypothetical protein